MIIHKITTGHVIQRYDTDSKTFLDQEFVAGDICEYETENGEVLDSDDIWPAKVEPYLSYNMVQP